MKQKSQKPRYAKFAQQLLSLRKQHKMSRSELAAACNIPINKVADYESGNNIPYGDLAEKMADLFSVTVEGLLCVESPKREMVMSQCLDELVKIYGSSIKAEALKTIDVTNFVNWKDICEHDQIALIKEMQIVFIDAKERVAQKYTPIKYRSAEREASIQARRELGRVGKLKKIKKSR